MLIIRSAVRRRELVTSVQSRPKLRLSANNCATEKIADGADCILS